MSNNKSSKDLATNFGNVIEIITGYTSYLKIEKKVWSGTSKTAHIARSVIVHNLQPKLCFIMFKLK